MSHPQAPMFLLSTLALAAPKGVILESAPIAKAIDAAPRHTLPAHSVVEVLARSTTWYGPHEDGAPGYPMWLVRGEREGWVSGEHLAVEQSWDSSAWVGEVPYRREVDSNRFWAAGREGREYTAKMEEHDRPLVDGWLVREREGALELLPLVDSNGWGSSHHIDRVILRDLTGDGHDEWILIIEETVTEAGSVGHRVVILDPSAQRFAPILDEPVHDPHWSGLDTTDKHGWGVLDVPARTLTLTYVHRTSCSSGTCISRYARGWTWTGEGANGGHSQSFAMSPMKGAVSAGPLWSSPNDFGEPEPPADGTIEARAVCVTQVAGPVGVGDVFQARLTDCGAEIIGWVPSDRIAWEDPEFDEILGAWPEEVSDPVRVVWE